MAKIKWVKVSIMRNRLGWIPNSLAFLVDIDVPELLEPEAVRLPRVGIK